jgi:trehalose 6-phosphate phosphatase
MVQPDNELKGWVGKASSLWLFLDYDGTLADFSPNPARLERDPELVRLIRQLAAVPRFRVTLISGRPLGALQELLPVSGIFLAGVYGIDIQTPAGDTIQRGDYGSIRPFLERARSRWERILNGKTGYYIEDKGWTLTLHGQSMDQTELGQTFPVTRLTASSGLPKNQFRWFVGRNFLEIAPIQANKGEAVKYLFSNFPFLNGRLVYIGDDDKDQEAFEPVHGLGGVTIQVAHSGDPVRFNGADYLLNSPQDVRQLLSTLL